jgi:hypothetical protein
LGGILNSAKIATISEEDLLPKFPWRNCRLLLHQSTGALEIESLAMVYRRKEKYA